MEQKFNESYVVNLSDTGLHNLLVGERDGLLKFKEIGIGNALKKEYCSRLSEILDVLSSDNNVDIIKIHDVEEWENIRGQYFNKQFNK